jgi:hypothetical protein
MMNRRGGPNCSSLLSSAGTECGRAFALARPNSRSTFNQSPDKRQHVDWRVRGLTAAISGSSSSGEADTAAGRCQGTQSGLKHTRTLGCICNLSVQCAQLSLGAHNSGLATRARAGATTRSCDPQRTPVISETPYRQPANAARAARSQRTPTPRDCPGNQALET